MRSIWDAAVHVVRKLHLGKRTSFEVKLSYEIFSCKVTCGLNVFSDEAPLYLMWGGNDDMADEMSCHEYEIKDGVLVTGEER